MATKIRVSNLHTDVKTMMQTMVDENAVDSADVTSIVNTNIASKSTSDISEGTNLYYTNARADARVALIVDAAPGTLNTLNELAAALGDDANFSTTVTNSIATKLPLAGGTITGNLTVNGDATFFKNTGGSSTYDFVSDHYTEIALTADYDGSHGGPHITSLIANGSTGSLAMRTNNVNRLQVAQNGDVNFFDDTGANAKFFWDASTERLGIGTDAPATALHVRGTASTVGATRSVVTLTDDTAMGINVGSGVAFRGLYTSAGAEANYGGIFAGKSNANSGNANGYLSLSYSASGTLTEGIRISETGKVGIGDSTPTANGLTLFSSVTGATRLNLHIGGSGTVPNSGSYNTISNNHHADILISSNAYINGNGNPVITSTHGNMGGTGIKISGASGSHDIKFYSSNAASVRGTELTNTEQMTISHVAVGIGTSTFGTHGKLQVAGGIGLTGNSEIRQSTNSDGSTLRFLGTQFVAGAANSHSYGYTDGALIAARASHHNALLFDVGTSNASGHKLKVLNDGSGAGGSLQYLHGSDTRFIVKSSTGNVGVGTSSPAVNLHIASTGSPQFRIQDYDQTNDWTTIGHNNGLMSINSRKDAASGSIAFRGINSNAEFMRIAASGNVGIGTTTPSTKLDISTSGADGITLNADTVTATASSLSLIHI